jgi:photosystem II stability/assembly factor-like uncharacterized protein
MNRLKKRHLLFLALLVFLLGACGSGGSTGQSATASTTPPPVNGFGSAQNHVHSLVVLPDAEQTLVLATHYGIFRSQNHGATWQKTAAGPNQPMQGLMAWWLTSNSLDPQRLYVLTEPATTPYSGTPGLYTSGDGGKTWTLSIASTKLTSGVIYFAQAGNDSPSEVYIYLSSLGPLGLEVSMDNGQHFAQAGAKLPFGDLLGLLPIPGQPGHLLAFGNDGIASTTDGGKHWQVLPHIQGSIFEMTTPGPLETIYATGDAGIYISSDEGKSFTLVYTQQYFASLTASPQQPQVVYGKLGLGVYYSQDSGKSWTKMPVIQSSVQAEYGDVLAADLTNAHQVYLALSYPTVVYHFQQANNTWQSLTPPV